MKLRIPVTTWANELTINQERGWCTRSSVVTSRHAGDSQLLPSYGSPTSGGQEGVASVSLEPLNAHKLIFFHYYLFWGGNLDGYQGMRLGAKPLSLIPVSPTDPKTHTLRALITP